MLESKLASIEKELQQAKKDNTALTCYINARRKGEAWRQEGARKKAEEDAQRKVMVAAPRLMRAKTPRMPVLGGSSPSIVVQDLSLLLLA
jgi:hypothetical protein